MQALGDFLPHRVRNPRRGRLLDHFLVAALQGTVAVAEIECIALAVADHLNFHVARVLKEFFQVDGVGTEEGFRFGACDVDRLQQIVLVIDHAHAAGRRRRPPP